VVQVLKPWQLSFLVHAGFIGLCLFFIFNKKTETEVYDIPVVISAPQEVQNLTEVKEQPKVVLKSINEPIPAQGKAREVFGASRESYTDSTLGAEGVEAKKGNTLAKAADQEKLLDSDMTSLPVPTEEYLVSEMPVVSVEVKPVYPQEAKVKKLEGKVALDVLIDEQGVVRQVQVIEGPEIFRTEASIAMRRFRFKPAKVDGKPVAVRIRYTLNFKLEY
jgi:TonB family protein